MDFDMEVLLVLVLAQALVAMWALLVNHPVRKIFEVMVAVLVFLLMMNGWKSAVLVMAALVLVWAQVRSDPSGKKAVLMLGVLELMWALTLFDPFEVITVLVLDMLAIRGLEVVAWALIRSDSSRKKVVLVLKLVVYVWALIIIMNNHVARVNFVVLAEQMWALIRWCGR